MTHKITLSLLMAYLLMLNLFFNLKIKVDTKQISAFFLFELKMVHKEVKKTQSINNTIGPELLTTYSATWLFRKFSNRDESLKDN